MQKMLIGLLLLVALAIIVGAVTHWYFGVATVALPVAATYIRLKLSTAYRMATDSTMYETLHRGK